MNYFESIILLLPGFLTIAAGTSHTVYACEGMMTSPLCESRHVIKVISAKYGRFWNTVCQVNKDNPPSYGIVCFSDQTAKVSEICDDRQLCRVKVVSNVFRDPCPAGVFKQLQITYQCVPGVLSSYMANASIPISYNILNHQKTELHIEIHKKNNIKNYKTNFFYHGMNSEKFINAVCLYISSVKICLMKTK
ncbi:hypothetical protein Btru_021210 [Bulinus truncatus]|nr:hypothetical protein Btru_021210 [Bulinus truncatus]